YQVSQAVVDLRPRAHELLRPALRIERPQLERCRVFELPVAGRTYASPSVAGARDILEDELASASEQMRAVAAVVERLIHEHATRRSPVSSDLQRSPP